MGLGIAGFVLAALTAFFVWRAADRFWHGFVILGLAIALFPLVARWLTGDLSRYLPGGIFFGGADGKDQIALASAVATILVAIMLAAGIWSAATAIWRHIQRK